MSQGLAQLRNIVSEVGQNPARRSQNGCALRRLGERGQLPLRRFPSVHQIVAFQVKVIEQIGGEAHWGCWWRGCGAQRIRALAVCPLQRELCNHLLFSLVENLKVVFSQVSDRQPVRVAHYHVHRHERYIDL